MKRLLLAGMILWGLPLALLADHLHWMGSYDKALQHSLTEHKPLLVLVADSSQVSRSIIQKQLMNRPYIAAMNKHFVAVIVNYEGKNSYPIEMYYTTVLPTLFFVDSSRELFLTKALYGDEITAERLGKIMQDLGIMPAKKR